MRFIIFIECTDRWMFTPTFSVCAGNRRCAPKLASVNVTIGNCSSVTLMPVCQGQCASEQRWDRNNNNKNQTKSCISHGFLTHPVCSCGSGGLCLRLSCRWSRCTRAVRSRAQRGDHWACSARTSRPERMTTNTSPRVNVERVAFSHVPAKGRCDGSNLDLDLITYCSKDHWVSVFFSQQK